MVVQPPVGGARQPAAEDRASPAILASAVDRVAGLGNGF